MADFPGDHGPCIGDLLPSRLTLDEERFSAAFEALQRAEQDTGRKMTQALFCAEVGVNERVLRAAKAGARTLPRHQVLRMAARLGCAALSVVKEPDKAGPLA